MGETPGLLKHWGRGFFRFDSGVLRTSPLRAITVFDMVKYIQSVEMRRAPAAAMLRGPGQ